MGSLGKLTSEPSHWERFDVNAARIKVLVYRSRSKIRQDLLLMLKLCRQQQSPPLPNLSELKVQCTCSEGELAILLSTLMHCHLQSLRVNSPYTTAVAAALSAAQLSSQSLQALSIHGTPDVLPLASGFTQLRVLTYFVAKSVIDSLSLTLLSRLTHLHTLDITAKLTTTSFNPDTQSNTSITTCFPALERLSLHGVLDLQTLSRFLRSITSPGLQHITIIYQQSRVLQTDMSALGKGLAAHTRLSSLNLSNLSSTSEKICVSNLSTHLCHLQNLEMVRLHSVLSDVEISKHLAIPQLTSTWSKLRRLTIACDSWACAPELEFLLRHFASNCPLLEYLYIAASVSVDTNFAAMNDLPPSPRIPRTLKICLVSRGNHEFVFDKTAALRLLYTYRTSIPISRLPLSPLYSPQWTPELVQRGRKSATGYTSSMPYGPPRGRERGAKCC